MPKDLTSGKLYSAVTRYWPRIAVGILATIGFVEVVVQGLTADSRIEIYLMAWGATTSGVWFLFDIAEKALSDEARARVAKWGRIDPDAAWAAAIPGQFEQLFDRVFGEKHVSADCFWRSVYASLGFACLVYILLDAFGVPGLPNRPLAYTGIFTAWALAILFHLPRPESRSDRLAHWIGLVLILLVGAVAGVTNTVIAPEAARVAFQSYGVILLFNILPDYLSLLQTRWAIRLMARSGRRTAIACADFAVTWFLWVVAVWIAGSAAPAEMSAPAGSWLLWPPALLEWLTTSDHPWRVAYLMSFLTTFFTSLWLWLYAASVLGSRTLLRMNSGVGFLLRITDVERQPIRSLGFVSVILVSCLFVLGLPLALL